MHVEMKSSEIKCTPSLSYRWALTLGGSDAQSRTYPFSTLLNSRALGINTQDPPCAPLHLLIAQDEPWGPTVTPSEDSSSAGCLFCLRLSITT